jgi:hypothetical protein
VETLVVFVVVVLYLVVESKEGKESHLPEEAQIPEERPAQIPEEAQGKGVYIADREACPGED